MNYDPARTILVAFLFSSYGLTVAGIGKALASGDKASFIMGTIVLMLASAVIAWVVTKEKP